MVDDSRVIAVDQGTGSTRSVSIWANGNLAREHQVSLGLTSPKPGWVEQDPSELLDTVVTVLKRAVARGSGPVSAVGLSNQRESALVWDAATGEPAGPMLGWQDRRTSSRAIELRASAGKRVRELSGLPLDPMFSALKMQWLLDQVDPDRARSSRGELRVGTVDSWLVKRLTDEDRIEVGNASRTQLLNIRSADWDDELLEMFDIPRAALPPVVPSDEPTRPIQRLGDDLAGIRICGIAGDSHAALFAHGVRKPGAVKVTYGTGSSVMGLTNAPVGEDSGLAETIGWSRGETARAFEGNILSTGGTLAWLGRLLDRTPQELADLALTVPDSGGVDLVPAFAGLGAPWWDEEAHALVTGFGLGTGAPHLARAALESIVLQIEDVLDRADAFASPRVELVLADGGPAQNDWLMQQQADLSGRTILRPAETGLSALGAGYLAGLGSGMWSDEDVIGMSRPRKEFFPEAGPDHATERRSRWAEAVVRARTKVNR